MIGPFSSKKVNSFQRKQILSKESEFFSKNCLVEHQVTTGHNVRLFAQNTAGGHGKRVQLERASISEMKEEEAASRVVEG